MRCVRCGQEFEGEFCPRCGAEAESGNQSYSTKEVKFSKPAKGQRFYKTRIRSLPVWATSLICFSGALVLTGILTLFRVMGGNNAENTGAGVVSVSSENQSEPETVSEQVQVYDDENITIWFDKRVSVGLQFKMENKTDKTITLQSTSIAVNQKNLNAAAITTLLAHKTKTSTVVCVVPDKTVYRISGQFLIYNYADIRHPYEIFYSDVQVREGGDLTDLAEIPVGAKVYQDDKIEIGFQEIRGNHVIFKVKNKTDETLVFQMDSLSLDDYDAGKITMETNVAPKSVGEITANCENLSGHTAAESISGRFMVSRLPLGENESYNADFTNVKIG